jgi:hypothetical protein
MPVGLDIWPTERINMDLSEFAMLFAEVLNAHVPVT